MSPTILCISAHFLVGNAERSEPTPPPYTTAAFAGAAGVQCVLGILLPHRRLGADPLEMALCSQMCLLLHLAHPRYSKDLWDTERNPTPVRATAGYHVSAHIHFYR